ncbi:MAG: (Fe-S)-binding protein [Verrucomicrobia bacterium]|nr:(Fe-S)-binding protein [Verrucomicrobiota bacterium]
MNPTATPIEHFLDEDKSLACIHCGLCLGSCPTYLETGNENDSPRGRIYLMRAVQDGRLPIGETAVRHIDLCLGCRACEAVCPSGVQYGELLEHTRDHLEHRHKRSWFQTLLRRVAIEQVFPIPERMRIALMPARAIKALRLEKFLPKFAREALSLLPEKMSASELPPVTPSDGERRARVGFISGCVMSVMFGETNENSVKLLTGTGCEVHTPGEQVCCGALFAHSGQLERARECARTNIAAFERLGLDAIIINAAGCGSTLKEYGGLLRDDPKWAERAAKFGAKVKDLTEFLVSGFGFRVEVGADTSNANAKPETQNPKPLVTYHDACHLCHAQRITKPPRELVKSVAGGNFVELPESDVCCGSAGSYNLTEPEMAERLQRRKTENILKTGAKVVVTTNPGCLLQIKAGLKKAGRGDIEAIHIADYLAREIK